MRNSFYHLLPVFLFLFLYDADAQTISSDFEGLSKGSDIILAGKVSEQKSQWNADKTMILTQVTISVDEYLKGGTPENTIVVTHPGGEVGDTGEYYSHIPVFTTNEEVLLFIKKFPQDNSYRVFEGESGKITLETDKVTGEKLTLQKTKLSQLKKEISRILSQE